MLTWKGINPIVSFINKIYRKGVKVTNKELQKSKSLSNETQLYINGILSLSIKNDGRLFFSDSLKMIN